MSEVHIVAPEDMSLRQSHDLGESLEVKLERLDEIERAFVHLDYEWTHRPVRNLDSCSLSTPSICQEIRHSFLFDLKPKTLLTQKRNTSRRE